MSDQLVGTLQQLLTERKKEALSTGSAEVVKWVFHRDGEPRAQEQPDLFREREKVTQQNLSIDNELA